MSLRISGLGMRCVKLGLIGVYTLVAAELFIRVVDPQPRMPRNVTSTPWGVRGNIPNAEYRHHTAEVDVRFKINAQGMRADRDFPEAKPEGVCRVAVMGDSFMMGYELDLQDTFADRLEKALNAAGRRTEVLNFAVSGFGTAESLRTYESYVRRFDPDVVLMEWDRSDYDDNVRSGLYELRNGELIDAGRTFLPSVGLQETLMGNAVYRWLVYNSDLYNFTREKLGLWGRLLSAQVQNLRIALRDRMNGAAAPAEAPPAYEQPWAHAISRQSVDLAAKLIERANREVTEDGRTFVMVEIPTQYQKGSIASASLMRPLIDPGVAFVSPVDDFNANAGRELLYYKSGDGHITPFAVGLLVAPVLKTLTEGPRALRCGGGG